MLDYLDAEALRWYWHRWSTRFSPMRAVVRQGVENGANRQLGTRRRQLVGNTSPRNSAAPRLRPAALAAGDAGQDRGNRDVSNRFLADSPNGRRLHRRQPLPRDVGPGRGARDGHPPRSRRPACRRRSTGLKTSAARLADGRILGALAAPSHRRKPLLRQAASAPPTFTARKSSPQRLYLDRAAMERHPLVGAKPSFDHEACAGLNLVFWHAFTCSPKEMGLPGQEYFAGTHFNPQITWAKQAQGS